jgi:hypothetical protein
MGRADWSLSMSKSECSYDLRRVGYSRGASRPHVPLLPIRGSDRICEDDARNGQRNSHWALNTIFGRNLVPLRQSSGWPLSTGRYATLSMVAGSRWPISISLLDKADERLGILGRPVRTREPA